MGKEPPDLAETTGEEARLNFFEGSESSGMGRCVQGQWWTFGSRFTRIPFSKLQLGFAMLVNLVSCDGLLGFERKPSKGLNVFFQKGFGNQASFSFGIPLMSESDMALFRGTFRAPGPRKPPGPGTLGSGRMGTRALRSTRGAWTKPSRSCRKPRERRVFLVGADDLMFFGASFSD